MNPTRLSVEFPAAGLPEDLEPAISMFHRFIQRGQVEGLILDVADYRHVPTGPGVLLVGHDIDYGVSGDAFTVVRKRVEVDVADALRDALRMGLGAIDAIGADGALAGSFDRSRFTVSVFDRRLGERDTAVAALGSEVEPVIAELYGGTATITPVDDDPRSAPSVRIDADAAVAGEALGKLGGSQAPGQSPWDISVEEYARLRESAADVVLVDVREESEYEQVNLDGKLVPLTTLGDHLDELDREARIVVHCRAGLRAPAAVEQLRAAGFQDVWHLNGGLMAWIDRVDPSLPRY